jgi:DUF1680 family protein
LKAATATALASSPALSIASKTAGAEVARELPYEAVQLTDGPMKAQYDSMHTHYLALDNDRLLKVYRERAGLPAPGVEMGGWYDLNGFVPGHTLGQYISGLSRIGASTGDVACHEKAHALVTGFAATLGEKNVSILRPETNLWVCYTLDKHFVGLIDSARLSHVEESKELLNRVLAGASGLLPSKGRDRIGKKDPPYDETYVMPENLFAAHELTGNPQFREQAMRYLLDREFFDVLARGGNPLPGQHAYSHAIALSSGGKALLTLGDSKYHDALHQAFVLLTTQQQFSSGGWGPNETFIEPHKGQLYDSLSSTVDHFETPCGAYAATKLARYLLRTTPDAEKRVQYADYLERVLYNTILAVKLPDSNGGYPYYSTYSPVATKVYYQRKWPCCSGTLVQTVADYPLNVYLQTERGVDVNLFVASQVKWKQDASDVTLVQETRYPADNNVVLRLKVSTPTEFTLNMRVPSWVSGRVPLRVNGKVVASGMPGTYAALRRRWSTGDVVEFAVPQEFRMEPIDDQHPTTVALMRGPVQYVALNLTAETSRDVVVAPSSLKEIGAEAFVENYSGRQAVFVPLFHVDNETYTTYFSKA